MPITLSVENTPDEIVHRLRARAERHHRSLQGELLAIIEAAIEATVAPDQERNPGELLAEIQRLGLRTPAESAAIVRANRDRR